MLIICKTDSEKIYDAETIFNQRLPVIKNEEELLDKTLAYFGYSWNSGYVMSPFGTSDLTDIRIACKLMICLQLFPALTFGTYGVSESELYKVLTVDRGRLLLKLETPLRRLIPVSAITPSGVCINNTTELNLYLFS